MPKTKKRAKTEEEKRQQRREYERKRRARIKENPALYAAFKEKDRARLAKKKERLQVKLVSDLTPRELRKQRKDWKERKARSRLNAKRKMKLLNHLRDNTPDTTDSEISLPRGSPSLLVNSPEENIARPKSDGYGSKDNSACSPRSTPNLVQNSPHSSPGATPTRQRTLGLKIAKTNPKSGGHGSKEISEYSLRSTPNLAHHSPRSSPDSTLTRQRIQGLKMIKANNAKARLIIKKQREEIEAKIKKIHSLQVKLLRANNRQTNANNQKCNPVKDVVRSSKMKRLRLAVTKFLERDDNSKLCPGKKDCIVKNKTKKQKRYLSDTMLNLHKKFQAEQKPAKISFASFCRWRPFWITSRKISERDTCLCVFHENTQLMFDKLKYLNIISHQNMRELCKTVVCDMNSETCMLRKCSICKSKVPKVNEFDDSMTTYKLWTVKKENRLIHGKEKEIRRTIKAEASVTKKTLLLKFLEVLEKFLVHQYYIIHQYTATTSLKTNLKEGEIFMQIDFSENYCCKYSSEIQAVHFGASRQQISLHTGVYYYKCPDTQEIKSKSFCTLSDCLRHDACAVSAHLQKILDQIRLLHPMDTLHIFSDGPTAQYRNKKAFYLFTQYITQRYGLRIATWNFSEAGHGKGPMDGVGAVVKRTADRVVRQGEDIPDLVTLTASLETNISNVKMFVVTETQIEDIDKLLFDQEKSIPETLKIHQITWDTTTPKRMNLRKLTCVTCKPGDMCSHYSLKKAFFDFTRSPCFDSIRGASAEFPADMNQQDVLGSGNDGDNESMTNILMTGDHILESEVDENPLHNTLSSDLKEGMWVVARFQSKKSENHFVGQVIGFESEEPKIKFTKKKRSTKDNFVFFWIEPEDIFPVPRRDIIAILTEPTPGRRGELLFNNVEVEKYKNIL